MNAKYKKLIKMIHSNIFAGRFSPRITEID